MVTNYLLPSLNFDAVYISAPFTNPTHTYKWRNGNSEGYITCLAYE